MAKYSLHIGVNEADSAHYGSALAPLASCHNDAHAMQHMAEYLGFEESRILLGEQATAAKVKQEITDYAARLTAGDFLFISYSGHGGSVPNLNEEVDPEEVADQTWCLYDRQLIDDELPHLWALFQEGVHILLFLDSCHSGTAARADMMIDDPIQVKLRKVLDSFFEKEGLPVKALPSSVEDALYFKHQDLYDEVIFSHAHAAAPMKASLKLLAACQDDQEARAGRMYSYFTLAFIQVMMRFAGTEIKNYDDLVKAMLKQALPTQLPNEFDLGVKDSYFASQAPFLNPAESYPEDVQQFFQKLRRKRFR